MKVLCFCSRTCGMVLLTPLFIKLKKAFQITETHIHAPTNAFALPSLDVSVLVDLARRTL